MSKSVKYYYNFISQPSRALWIALKLGKTPFSECFVALQRREQLSDDFNKINRFQKVPCITDGDFHLSESVAILRYLATKDQIGETLYPKELYQRARVDEFLEWHHIGLRYPLLDYFQQLFLYPKSGLSHTPSEEKVASLQNKVENSLRLMEDVWLKDTNFLVGNQLTAADLFGACEVEQLRFPMYDIKEKFNKIPSWLEKVREATNPFYDEAHQVVYKTSTKSRKQGR